MMGDLFVYGENQTEFLSISFRLAILCPKGFSKYSLSLFTLKSLRNMVRVIDNMLIISTRNSLLSFSIEHGKILELILWNEKP